MSSKILSKTHEDIRRLVVPGQLRVCIFEQCSTVYETTLFSSEHVVKDMIRYGKWGAGVRTKKMDELGPLVVTRVLEEAPQGWGGTETVIELMSVPEEPGNSPEFWYVGRANLINQTKTV